MFNRFLAISGAVMLVLVVAIGVVYAFGTPQAPSPEIRQQVAASAVQSPGGGSVEVAQGEVPPADPNVPLAIQIPGCKCHSKDPKLVEEHSKYRMNQCGGCHGGKTPTGQR